MSFIIKGGCDLFRKQIINVSLKRTNKWTRGLLLVPKNTYVVTLVPRNENNIEMVKYNDIYALLLNNSIIYENNKLFSYKIDLQVETEPDLTDKHLYNFMEYNYVDFKDMKKFNTLRTLN